MILCLRDLGYHHEMIVTEQLCLLSQEAYPDGTEQDLGTADYWLGMREYDFCFTWFVDQVPMAYLDFLSFSPVGVGAFLHQEIHDGEIAPEWLQAPQPNTALVLYGASVVVKQDQRRGGLARRLFRAARQWFLDHSFQVTDVYCTVWSQAGEAVVQRLGGQPCGCQGAHQRFHIATKNHTLPVP